LRGDQVGIVLPTEINVIDVGGLALGEPRPGPQLRASEINSHHANNPKCTQPSEDRDALPDSQVDEQRSRIENATRSHGRSDQVVASKQGGSILRV
jgi:hypothetical protein